MPSDDDSAADAVAGAAMSGVCGRGGVAGAVLAFACTCYSEAHGLCEMRAGSALGLHLGVVYPWAESWSVC